MIPDPRVMPPPENDDEERYIAWYMEDAALEEFERHLILEEEEK